jgi:hypothetical protein
MGMNIVVVGTMGNGYVTYMTTTTIAGLSHRTSMVAIRSCPYQAVAIVCLSLTMMASMSVPTPTVMQIIQTAMTAQIVATVSVRVMAIGSAIAKIPLCAQAVRIAIA